METIAVTKPDMAVLRRNRLGLSPFGLLSQAFAAGILNRAGHDIGPYREFPLEFLEEGELEDTPAPNLYYINLELKVILDALRKEQKPQPDGKKKEPPEIRILERVIEIERQREREQREHLLRIRLEGPGTRHRTRTFLFPVKEEAPTAGDLKAGSSGQTVPLTVSETGAAFRRSPAPGISPMKPASFHATVPAGEGWTPREAGAMPGMPSRPLQGKMPPVGGRSILYPDVARWLRAEGLTYAQLGKAASAQNPSNGKQDAEKGEEHPLESTMECPIFGESAVPERAAPDSGAELAYLEQETAVTETPAQRMSKPAKDAVHTASKLLSPMRNADLEQDALPKAESGHTPVKKTALQGRRKDPVVDPVKESPTEVGEKTTSGLAQSAPRTPTDSITAELSHSKAVPPTLESSPELAYLEQKEPDVVVSDQSSTSPPEGQASSGITTVEPLLETSTSSEIKVTPQEVSRSAVNPPTLEPSPELAYLEQKEPDVVVSDQPSTPPPERQVSIEMTTVEPLSAISASSEIKVTSQEVSGSSLKQPKQEPLPELAYLEQKGRDIVTSDQSSTSLTDRQASNEIITVEPLSAISASPEMKVTPQEVSHSAVNPPTLEPPPELAYLEQKEPDVVVSDQSSMSPPEGQASSDMTTVEPLLETSTSSEIKVTSQEVSGSSLKQPKQEPLPELAYLEQKGRDIVTSDQPSAPSPERQVSIEMTTVEPLSAISASSEMKVTPQELSHSAVNPPTLESPPVLEYLEQKEHSIVTSDQSSTSPPDRQASNEITTVEPLSATSTSSEIKVTSQEVSGSSLKQPKQEPLPELAYLEQKEPNIVVSDQSSTSPPEGQVSSDMTRVDPLLETSASPDFKVTPQEASGSLVKLPKQEPLPELAYLDQKESGVVVSDQLSTSPPEGQASNEMKTVAPLLETSASPDFKVTPQEISHSSVKQPKPEPLPELAYLEQKGSDVVTSDQSSTTPPERQVSIEMTTVQPLLETSTSSEIKVTSQEVSGSSVKQPKQEPLPELAYLEQKEPNIVVSDQSSTSPPERQVSSDMTRVQSLLGTSASPDFKVTPQEASHSSVKQPKQELLPELAYLEHKEPDIVGSDQSSMSPPEVQVSSDMTRVDPLLETSASPDFKVTPQEVGRSSLKLPKQEPLPELAYLEQKGPDIVVSDQSSTSPPEVQVSSDMTRVDPLLETSASPYFKVAPQEVSGSSVKQPKQEPLPELAYLEQKEPDIVVSDQSSTSQPEVQVSSDMTRVDPLLDISASPDFKVTSQEVSGSSVKLPKPEPLPELAYLEQKEPGIVVSDQLSTSPPEGQARIEKTTFDPLLDISVSPDFKVTPQEVGRSSLKLPKPEPLPELAYLEQKELGVVVSDQSSTSPPERKVSSDMTRVQSLLETSASPDFKVTPQEVGHSSVKQPKPEPLPELAYLEQKEPDIVVSDQSSTSPSEGQVSSDMTRVAPLLETSANLDFKVTPQEVSGSSVKQPKQEPLPELAYLEQKEPGVVVSDQLSTSPPEVQASNEMKTVDPLLETSASPDIKVTSQEVSGFSVKLPKQEPLPELAYLEQKEPGVVVSDQLSTSPPERQVSSDMTRVAPLLETSASPNFKVTPQEVIGSSVKQPKQEPLPELTYLEQKGHDVVTSDQLSTSPQEGQTRIEKTTVEPLSAISASPEMKVTPQEVIGSSVKLPKQEPLPELAYLEQKEPNVVVSDRSSTSPPERQAGSGIATVQPLPEPLASPAVNISTIGTSVSVDDLPALAPPTELAYLMQDMEKGSGPAAVAPIKGLTEKTDAERRPSGQRFAVPQQEGSVITGLGTIPAADVPWGERLVEKGDTAESGSHSPSMSIPSAELAYLEHGRPAPHAYSATVSDQSHPPAPTHIQTTVSPIQAMLRDASLGMIHPWQGHTPAVSISGAMAQSGAIPGQTLSSVHTQGQSHPEMKSTQPGSFPIGSDVAAWTGSVDMGLSYLARGAPSVQGFQAAGHTIPPHTGEGMFHRAVPAPTGVPFPPPNSAALRPMTPTADMFYSKTAGKEQAVGETGTSPAFLEELTYTWQPPEQAGQAAVPSPPAGDASEYEKSLPGWAQDFLSKNAVSGGMTVGRPISAFQQPESGEQVQWTAPGAIPRPANVVYREKEHRPVQELQIPAMSDRELRRTADQVYRLIEERIRRECRRIGL